MVGQGSPDCQIAWDCSVASYAADGSLRWKMKPALKENENNSCTSATLSVDGRFLYVAGATSLKFGDPVDLFIAKYALPE